MSTIRSTRTLARARPLAPAGSEIGRSLKASGTYVRGSQPPPGIRREARRRSLWWNSTGVSSQKPSQPENRCIIEALLGEGAPDLWKSVNSSLSTNPPDDVRAPYPDWATNHSRAFTPTDGEGEFAGWMAGDTSDDSMYRREVYADCPALAGEEEHQVPLGGFRDERHRSNVGSC